MGTSFVDRAAQMARIQRGDERYGEGSAALQATRFYLDHLLDEAVRRARAASVLPTRRVDLLISLCGFAATPTVLASELLQPRRLLVLRSKDAAESVNLIGGHLVMSGKLDFETFQHETVDPSDPLDMYAKISKWLGGRDGRDAVIDITGGRKVMSAAAALAAWQLNLRMTYVENRYDPVTRKPLPGEDRLITLDNPTTLFGDQEMQRALETFRSGAYEAARQRYAEICERVAVPGRARLMRSVAELYRTWCDLDLPALPAAVAGVRDSLPAVQREVSPALTGTLHAQLAFAERLAAGEPTAFVVCFYLLGRHYQQVSRHDFAALLFYRTIEACLTSRLRARYPGFDPDNCDYGLIDAPDRVRRRYQELGRALGSGLTQGPPAKMTLFAAAQLLVAEADDMMATAGFTDASGTPDLGRLQRLQERTRARNKSVLAHGTAAISASDTDELRKEAAELLTGYWARHGDGGDLDNLLAELRFLRVDR
ncbi:TIGR02710 family CRISPR-associated CARF protein [Micromonospora inyonensis]|uniref:CRISPR-associated protein, TIGR02710 family n=1 Tax=Micromonospora inyonensis TaxID=47866 RepID=A0A1C6S0F4_9ACTN|nr:TIGR02710 family CRISPR-associated CARF protein [Micromonospora inyonensis]SCL22941.1 CRISPR-associated protein, TIGR02710 family [Micromonospora inyonensis]